LPNEPASLCRLPDGWYRRSLFYAIWHASLPEQIRFDFVSVPQDVSVTGQGCRALQDRNVVLVVDDDPGIVLLLGSGAAEGKCATDCNGSEHDGPLRATVHAGTASRIPACVVPVTLHFAPCSLHLVTVRPAGHRRRAARRHRHSRRHPAARVPAAVEASALPAAPSDTPDTSSLDHRRSR